MIERLVILVIFGKVLWGLVECWDIVKIIY